MAEDIIGVQRPLEMRLPIVFISLVLVVNGAMVSVVVGASATLSALSAM